VDSVASADVELAHELADTATEAARPHIAEVVAHDSKLDGTPVSRADWAAEAAMIEILRRARPDDGILSEESGVVATGERRWVLDPIDGTAEFVRGGVEWGTHVALEVGGEVVMGIITRPRRHQRWWAARGWGAFVDDEETPMARAQTLAVSDRSSLDGARVGLYAMGPSEVEEILPRRGIEVVARGSHILDLVEGRLDAIVSHQCGFVWDHAPAVVLTVEAGGLYVDPEGGCDAGRHGGVYANRHLAAPLRAALEDEGVRLAGVPIDPGQGWTDQVDDT
jgi:histidinol-phosphatase